MNDAEAIALALEEAKSAALRGEVPVGAVLLGQEGVLLAHDGNRILELKDPTAHAEMLVMRAAAVRATTWRWACTAFSRWPSTPTTIPFPAAMP